MKENNLLSNSPLPVCIAAFNGRLFYERFLNGIASTFINYELMKHDAKSVRTFIGAKDYTVSRKFYTDLGFQESVISGTMSYFNIHENLGFYLQDYYVADWINNSMIFLEVNNVEEYYRELQKMDLPTKYDHVKLVPIRYESWGKECFLHDPAGVLWHFGEFNP